LLLGSDRLLGDLTLTTLIKGEGTEASRNHGLLDVGVKYWTHPRLSIHGNLWRGYFIQTWSGHPTL